MKLALLFCILLIGGCRTNFGLEETSEYRLQTGDVVYCWFIEHEFSGLKGYTYHSGNTGDVPALVGKPLKNVKELAKSIRRHGDKGLILIASYPGVILAGENVRPRPLNPKELSILTNSINVTLVVDR